MVGSAFADARETVLLCGVENGLVVRMEGEVHVRKRKDGVWRVRELLTVPNWAVVELLAKGQPRTSRQIYAALGKQLTRKTLIRSMKTLSLELRALEPQHVKTEKGYEVGYSLSKPVLENMQALRKMSALLDKG